jgi:tetratricopeptide (TPR) repeat protein
MPLEKEEQRHVTAAEGFLELGLPLDADAELDRVDPFCRHLPEVLEVRAKVHRALKRWELLAVVAKQLWDSTDQSQWASEWARALRQSGALESAKAVLLDAVERHPENALFHFQLACYESQIGSVEVAKFRLEHAVKRDPSLKMRALDEPDLEPIWKALG